MVFFNYATMQMAAKIVYYGPGLCGKTTNLHQIYAKTSPQSRGEMVSLETETDRTLFFDLLPIDVGVIGGFKTRLQLYTVPGQVFYNTTRKLVLKGADGIVFVADSQRAMLDANSESFKNLRENLAEIGLDLDEIPLVVQLNKRDLPNVASREEIMAMIGPAGKYESVEATAVNGGGVFETLKTISKLTLRTLRKRMMGDEPAKPVMQMTVRKQGDPPILKPSAAPSTPPPAAPVPAPVAPPPPQQLSARTVAIPAMPAVAAAMPQPASATTAVAEPAEMLQQPVAPPAPVVPEAAPVPPAPVTSVTAEELAAEPEVNFSTERVAKAEEPVVKHVKVRSNVDIMAELESLRKKSTQGPPKSKKDPLAALNALTAPPKKASDTRTLSVAASPAAGKTRKIRVELSFEDEAGTVIHSDDQSVSLENASTIQSLLLNLKIDFGSGQSN